MVGVCCVEGEQDVVGDDKIQACREIGSPSPPVVGVCCVEGEAIAFVYLYVVYAFVTCVDESVNVNVYACLYLH